jgi:uncharacterized protein HemX
MAEKWLAVMGLLACLAVWAGMALGPVRRARLLQRARRLQAGLQALGRRLRTHARHTARRPQQARDAQREAAEAIERARRRPRVDRQGNVYRPDAFNTGKGDDTTRGDDKLH